MWGAIRSGMSIYLKGQYGFDGGVGGVGDGGEHRSPCDAAVS